MKKVLTKRQQDIMDFIVDFIQKRGYPPTLREIGNEFGISSTNGVRVNLAALEKKEHIVRRPWLSRGIEIVQTPKAESSGPDVGCVPIIGKVTAGKPIFAAENIEGTLTIDDSFISTNKVFALKAQGDSMSGIGIMNGDMVLVRRQHTANIGEVLVFIIGDEITVKRYNAKGDKMYLIPENDAYETRTMKKNSPDVQIVGKVVGVIRRY